MRFQPPTSPPFDDIKVVVDMLKLKFTNFYDDFQAVLAVLMYANAQLAPTPSEFATATTTVSTAALSDSDMAMMLQVLSDRNVMVTSSADLVSFPWEQLLPILADLIRRLIERRRKRTGN